MKINIRLIYLYLFSAIGLIISVIAIINVVDLTLRSTVFTKADDMNYGYYPMVEPIDSENASESKISEEIRQQNITSQKQREISNSIAMLMVGVPLYLYHWKTIQKGKSKK